MVSLYNQIITEINGTTNSSLFLLDEAALFLVVLVFFYFQDKKISFLLKF